jgi:ABC-2 type transport system ATP-binding protein
MLMNTVRPTEGTARMLGMDVVRDRAALRRRIGYVPELHYMYRWMRVRDATWFCRAFYPTWSEQRCRELLGLFELDSNKRVRQLSKGMVAKLALVLALAHDPELLILDEPTSGLDPLVREEFLDGVLRTICDGRRTVLFSSHVMSDVQRIADRVTIFHNGRPLASCTTDELLTRTKRVRAVISNGSDLGEPPAGTVWQEVRHREWLLTIHGFNAAILDTLQQNPRFESVEVQDLGLEEIFKDFIKGQRRIA